MMTSKGFFRAGRVLTVEMTDSSMDANGGNTFTFSNMGIGPDTEREILVGTVIGSSAQPDGVTIGGVAATPVGLPAGVANVLRWWLLPGTIAGTTATIVVNISSGAGACAIVVYRMTGRPILTPFDAKASNASDPSVNLNISKNGVGVAIATTNGPNPSAWSGLDENEDAQFGANNRYTSASRFFDADITGHPVSVSLSGGTSGMTALSFAP